MFLASLCLLARAAPPPSEWVPAPSFAFHVEDGVQITDLVAGDFDADGYDDVAWSAHGGAWHSGLGVSLVRGGPGGLAGSPEALPIDGLEVGHLCTLAATDLTGDGIDDLVVGVPGPSTEIWPGEIQVFAGSPSGLPAQPTFRVSGGPGIRNLGKGILPAGDLDGDGRLDLLVEHEFYSVWSWMRGTGTDLELHAEWSIQGDPIAADLDGDGYPEIVRVLTGQSVVSVYPGGPDGPGSTASWTLDRPYPSGGVADATGDGLPDVGVFAAPDPTIEWFSFAGGPPTAPALTTPGPGIATLDGPGDLDGDGRADWIATTWQFRLALISGASASLLADWVLTSPWSVGTFEARPVAGDFDGSGCPDLAVRSEVSWLTGMSTYQGYNVFYTEEDVEVASFLCPAAPPESPPGDTSATTPTTDPTSPADSGAPPAGASPDDRGCGCATGGAVGGWSLLVALALALGRRHEAGPESVSATRRLRWLRTRRPR